MCVPYTTKMRRNDQAGGLRGSRTAVDSGGITAQYYAVGEPQDACNNYFLDHQAGNSIEDSRVIEGNLA